MPPPPGHTHPCSVLRPKAPCSRSSRQGCWLPPLCPDSAYSSLDSSIHSPGSPRHLPPALKRPSAVIPRKLGPHSMPRQATDRACGCSERPCPHPALLCPKSGWLRPRQAPAKDGEGGGGGPCESHWLPPPQATALCVGGFSPQPQPWLGSVTAASSRPLSPEGGNGFLGATLSLVSALAWSPPRKCPFAKPSPVSRLTGSLTGS